MAGGLELEAAGVADPVDGEHVVGGADVLVAGVALEAVGRLEQLGADAVLDEEAEAVGAAVAARADGLVLVPVAGGLAGAVEVAGSVAVGLADVDGLREDEVEVGNRVVQELDDVAGVVGEGAGVPRRAA